MAHAIARRHHRRRRHANPYKTGRGRHARWHRLDGKFAARAGGRRLRKHKGHVLRSNPVRHRRSRRHTRAIVRLFDNPFRSGRGRARRWRRKDGAFSKRAGGGRARKYGRHKLYKNPSSKRRRRRKSRKSHAIARRAAPKRRRRKSRKGHRRAKRRSRKHVSVKRQRIIHVGRRTPRMSPIHRTMVGY